MIWKNIKENLLTAVSLVWSLLQIVLSYLISCYQMVRAFGVPISAFFQEKFDRKDVPDIQSTNLNYGIALVIILVFIVLVF